MPPASVVAGAGTITVIFADVAWEAVAAVAAGAVVGGWFGAKVGRRIPPIVLRVLVVVIGLVVAIRLMLR